MSNQLAAQKPKFSVAMTTDKYKDLINNTLGDPNRARRFSAAITSAVAVNKDLQECDAGSILSGALLGESLNLSPSPQLGHYYLVPYNDTKSGIKQAQFQLGYKGYIQLAIRSGQYKKMVVSNIKAGELEYYNPIDEEIKIRPILDDAERDAAETIGYYAMFEYTNGFRKVLYWSKEKMERHALQYSPGYKKDKEKGWNYTFWSKDFDGMAYKTMLRQLISKWGIMSIDMQTAFSGDMAMIHEDGTQEYVDVDNGVNDTPNSTPDPVDGEVVQKIDSLDEV